MKQTPFAFMHTTSSCCRTYIPLMTIASRIVAIQVERRLHASLATRGWCGGART